MASDQNGSDNSKLVPTTRRSALRLVGAVGLSALTTGAASAAVSRRSERSVDARADGVTSDYPNDAVLGDSTGASTRTLRIHAVEDGPRFEYEFTVDGDVTKAAPTGSTAAEGNDTVTEDGEQTTVTGVTGNGFGDTYELSGPLSSFSATVNASHLTVSLDGEDVTDGVLSGGVDGVRPGDGSGESGSGGDESRNRLVVIDGTSNPEVSNYFLEVTGTVERAPAHSSVTDGGAKWDSLGDEVTDTTVVGVVGRGKDAYRFSGDLQSIEIRGDASAVVRGD